MNKSEIIREEYYKNPEFSRKKLARKLEVDEAYIRRVIRPLKKQEIKQGHKPIEEEVKFNRTSTNNATLDLKSITINTLEKALEVAEVDMTQWKVDRYEIGSWQVTMKLKVESGEVDERLNPIMVDKPKTVTMYRIRVWLKKLHDMDWVEAIRSLVKTVPKMKTPKREFKLDGKYLLEISLADTHFGMLAWGDETQHDYDLKIAEELFLYAVKDSLAKTIMFKPSRILFPIGNDFFHINDHTNQTPAHKNILDVDSRLIKIYEKAKLAVIKAINYCRKVAPVDILWVPGNHDPFLSYYLVDVIDHIFQDDKDVTVNKSPRTRKFYQYGKNLILFTHGMDEKTQNLPVIAATEEPKLWANTNFREAHIGHTHTKKTMVWTGIDTNHGMLVRTIPSIATSDSWHYRKGFIRNNFAAQSFLWDNTGGMIGSFTSYVDHLYKKQNKT
jgi:hypothetical protein